MLLVPLISPLEYFIIKIISSPPPLYPPGEEEEEAVSGSVAGRSTPFSNQVMGAATPPPVRVSVEHKLSR